MNDYAVPVLPSSNHEYLNPMIESQQLKVFSQKLKKTLFFIWFLSNSLTVIIKIIDALIWRNGKNSIRFKKQAPQAEGFLLSTPMTRTTSQRRNCQAVTQRSSLKINFFLSLAYYFYRVIVNIYKQFVTNVYPSRVTICIIIVIVIVIIIIILVMQDCQIQSLAVIRRLRSFDMWICNERWRNIFLEKSLRNVCSFEHRIKRIESPYLLFFNKKSWSEIK